MHLLLDLIQKICIVQCQQTALNYWSYSVNRMQLLDLLALWCQHNLSLWPHIVMTPYCQQTVWPTLISPLCWQTTWPWVTVCFYDVTVWPWPTCPTVSSRRATLYCNSDLRCSLEISSGDLVAISHTPSYHSLGQITEKNTSSNEKKKDII